MRRLLLMRHGKSDWDTSFERDHDRPLSDRGVRSARLMGRLLSGRGMEPQLVISSTAVRARTTAWLASESGSWAAPVELDERLYESGPGGVIDSAREAPDVARLMLVGHQPTWGLLIERLVGEWVEMKTASVAVIDFEMPGWSGLGGGSGTLVEVFHPRDYFGSELDVL